MTEPYDFDNPLDTTSLAHHLLFEQEDDESQAKAGGVMSPCSGYDIFKKICRHGFKDRAFNVICAGTAFHVTNKKLLTPPCVENNS